MIEPDPFRVFLINKIKPSIKLIPRNITFRAKLKHYISWKSFGFGGLTPPEPPVNNIAWHQQAGGFALPTPQQTQKGTIYTLLLRLLCSSISKVLACFGKSMYKTRCLRFSISGVLGIHLLPLDPLRRTTALWILPTFILQWPPPINNPRTGLVSDIVRPPGEVKVFIIIFTGGNFIDNIWSYY